MSTPAPGRVRERLIPPGVLARLANLELIARRVVDGSLTGLHRSPRFGISQEFAEYRAYTPGDDLRFLDWNVYARTDRTYIKRFFGDTNTRLLLLLDASASMGALAEARGNATLALRRPATADTSAVSKLDYARFLAASLVYLAARQHDAVGLLVFDAAIREYRAPTARALGVRRLYHLLDTVAAQGETNWQAALSHVAAQATGKNLLVLISDCYVDPEQFGGALRNLGVRGHDLLVIHVLNPDERQVPVAGGTTFKDAESGRVMDVAAEDLLHGYPQRLAAHIERVRRETLAAGGHYLQMDTNQPLDASLIRYLKFRSRYP